MIATATRPAESFLARIAIDAPVPDSANVEWQPNGNVYQITSTFAPIAGQFQIPEINNPVMEIGMKMPPAFPVQPLTVQYGAAFPEKICGQGSFSAYKNGDVVNIKKFEETLAGRINVAAGLRLVNQSDQSTMSEEKSGLLGLLIKGHILVYELAHAERAGIALQRVGVDMETLTPVASPVDAAGFQTLMDQALGHHVFFTAPEDVATPADFLCAEHLAAGGPVVEVPIDAPVSVIDSIVWPATWALLWYDRNMPAFAELPAGLPTPLQLLKWLQRYSQNHGAAESFDAAATEAAAIVGATWALTPAAPIANANIPYLVVQPQNAIDTVLDLDEDDTRLAREDNPWPPHPQAMFQIRTYTPNGIPVIMTAVPHLPTQKVRRVAESSRLGERGFLR